MSISIHPFPSDWDFCWRSYPNAIIVRRRIQFGPVALIWWAR
jgi:hypothetical protein